VHKAQENKKMSNQMTVKVRRLGSPYVRVTLTENSTVQDAFRKANISIGDNESIWVNGDEALKDTVLKDNETVILQGDIKQGI
jgi:hypothetical protein